MPYQIIILNGEKRGERLNVGRSALSIGREASCEIQLSDPAIEKIHATISTNAEGLQISALGKTHHLTVNKSDVQTSSLKHGDVIEIGTTRLFVQSQRSPGTWDSLTKFRQWRKWVTIGLPILILAFIILTFRQCHSDIPEAPISKPTLIHNYTPDTNNTDWIVTNVPQIMIHPSIILTSLPPEIVDAQKALIRSSNTNIQMEIDAALNELEFATSFLNEARKHDSETPTLPDSTLSKTILQQAEESLSLSTSVSSLSVTTNSIPNVTTNEAITNRVEDLKN